MHFSAKRGIAIACCLSVRPSVCPSVCGFRGQRIERRYLRFEQIQDGGHRHVGKKFKWRYLGNRSSDPLCFVLGWGFRSNGAISGSNKFDDVKLMSTIRLERNISKSTWARDFKFGIQLWWGMPSGRRNNFPWKWAWLRSRDPYPSDSLASCWMNVDMTLPAVTLSSPSTDVWSATYVQLGWKAKKAVWVKDIKQFQKTSPPLKQLIYGAFDL